MNRIQFFYDEDIISLEMKVNEWLLTNKEIKIINSNLQTLGAPSSRAGITNGEKYVFFILYSVTAWETLLSEKATEEIIPTIEHLETKSNIKITQS